MKPRILQPIIHGVLVAVATMMTWSLLVPEVRGEVIATIAFAAFVATGVIGLITGKNLRTKP